MQIIFTEDFKIDLEEIKDFIGKDSVGIAIGFTNGLLKKLIRILYIFPEVGKIIQSDKQVRKLQLAGTNYFAVYFIENKNIYVLRVLHNSRNFKNILEYVKY